MFSSSDLGRLKGKQQTAVERIYVENRDVDHVARELFVNTAALDNLVARARRKLASVGVRLPDRRSAIAIGSRPEFAH